MKSLFQTIKYKLAKKTLAKIRQTINCNSDWFKAICESYNYELTEYKGIQLPGFPDEQMQINTTGKAGHETLCEAYIFYADCMCKFKACKNMRSGARTLLDFGVGWGRILRFFVRDFPLENMYGVDVDADYLSVCNSIFPYGTFIKSEAYPPLSLADESIDFIVGFSVFSHLSEESALAWMKEFNRILRPGGMVALTTRGRWFFDSCESQKNMDGYAGNLGKMFDDFDDAKKRYDNGEFVHSNTKEISGGGATDESFYGESFIPESYAKNTYSEYFNVLDYVFKLGRQTHPIMFFQKPE